MPKKKTLGHWDTPKHGPYKWVVIELTVQNAMRVPADFDADNIEFYINGSSSCFANRFTELVETDKRLDFAGSCACGMGEGRYVRDATEDDAERFALSVPPQERSEYMKKV